YLQSNDDPATVSLNTVRGEAMHSVVRYALWVRRNLLKEDEVGASVSHGLGEMPEVKEVLEAHLDPTRDPSLSVQAIYGLWFPSLVFLDRNWSTENMSGVFPNDEGLVLFRDAAWEAYVMFAEPNGNVFEVLYDEYRSAVMRIGLSSRRRN